MGRPLKVWAGWIIRPVGAPPRTDHRGPQVHVVVAATSQQQAREALGVGRRTFDNYLSETGNPTDIAVALSEPGVAQWCEMDPPRSAWRRCRPDARRVMRDQGPSATA